MKNQKNKNKVKAGKPPKLRVVGRQQQKPNEFGPADAAYFRELHAIVDQVFSEAEARYGWTWSHLAAESGLAYQTVANLGDRKTKWPQFRTVWRLCKAIGWDLVTKSKPKNQRTTLALAKTA